VVTAPKLIVGLGNPGPEYSGTRHNAGFWLAERLAQQASIVFTREARFHGLVAHARDRGSWLLMPLTYMNRSGLAVGALARFFRIAPSETIVLHDELDIPPGSLRLKFGGGTGGHNGLKDIASHLGSHDFWRLRIGIGHPGERDEVLTYVLKAPRAEEQSAIDSALERATQGWPLIERGEYPAAMQKFNARPPTPPAGNGASTVHTG
jgi:PTH1 family peptidyl-tRNA hydrolase